MAITKLTLAKKQPDITFNATTTEFQENWILTSDEISRPSLIRPQVLALGNVNSFGFPGIGSPHESDPSVLVVDYNLGKVIDDTYTKFTLVVSYSNQISAINNSVAPLAAEPTYSFDKVDKTVVISVDAQDDTISIANTNGRPIIVTETKTLLRFTMVRNEPDYDPKLARKFMDTINDGSVRLAGKTFPDRTCKLELWAGASFYDSTGSLYWAVTYQVLIDEEDGFKRKFVNRDVVDKNGKAASATGKGLIANTEYKLQENGEFYSKEDQQDPTKFFEVGPFNTLPKANWGVATQLGSSPSGNLNDLANNIDSGNNLGLGGGSGNSLSGGGGFGL